MVVFFFKADMSKPTQKGQIFAQAKRLNQRYSLLPAGKAHILGDKRTHIYVYTYCKCVLVNMNMYIVYVYIYIDIDIHIWMMVVGHQHFSVGLGWVDSFYFLPIS